MKDPTFLKSATSKEYKLELVAPEVFRVWRASPFQTFLPFPPQKIEPGKFITWAVTSDRCIHQLVLSNDHRFSQSKIGKAWDTLTAFSREQSFENFLAKLLEEGWQLVPPPKKKLPKLPLFPSVHSKGKKPQNIYEAFTPEALLSEEFQKLEIPKVEEVKTVRELVTPVIRHLPSALEKSIDKLELLARDEDLKRRITKAREKRRLPKEQARRLKELNRLFDLVIKPKEPFSKHSPTRIFKSKQEMLEYIKNKLHQEKK